MKRRDTSVKRLSPIGNDMQYNAYAQRFSELTNLCVELDYKVNCLQAYVQSNPEDKQAVQNFRDLSSNLRKVRLEVQMLQSRLQEYAEKRCVVARNYQSPNAILGFYSPRRYG